MSRLVAFALGAAAASGDRNTRASVIQSAKDTQDRLTPKPDVIFQKAIPGSNSPIVDVSSLELDQTILGFGGAFTEAAADVFKGMTPANQQTLLTNYFDAQQGIGYTVGRVHINSCDFSPKPGQWSEDDVAGDFDLVHFDMALVKDQNAMIPFIKDGMQEVQKSNRVLKLFASPWSPPAWMKTNGAMDDNGKDGSLKADSRAVWANFMAKWITAYKAAGVPLWAVTPQNEPENKAIWEGCTYTAQEEADWVGTHLGPTLKSAHPEVLILAYDHNKDHVYDWARTFYTHPTASKYIAGIALHWYTGDQFNNVARIRAEYPQAMLLPTEATWEKWRWTPGTTVAAGDWKMGEGYAHDIIGDLNAGSVGWTDWNLLLDETGGPNHVGNNCDAAMMADNSKQELYMHPQYYYIGHFSKYIVPESRYIKSSVIGSKHYEGPGRPYGTCTADDGLQATAFLRPDDQIVVVVLNCGASKIDFQIQAPEGLLANVTVPAHAIQTYLFPKPSSAEKIII